MKNKQIISLVTFSVVLLLLFVFEFTRIPALHILMRVLSYNVSNIINPYVLDFLLLGYLLPHTVDIAVRYIG
jgi:hypothetical protein